MGQDRATLPDFQSLMLPVLRDAERGEVYIGDTVERLADAYELTPEQRADLIPSGKQTTFSNRVNWSKSYLGKAGLISLTKRGHFTLSDDGRQLLKNPPSRLSLKLLKQLPSYKAAESIKRLPEQDEETIQDQRTLTPDERMRQARDEIESDLASEILRRLSTLPPEFFEKTVVRLLVAMGYGGSLSDAGRALGRSGDGGVDGVIDEDALGLDRIYVQAKRYKDGSPVGPGAIRDFFGALDQFKAGKGLFVTTSTFSASAVSTAAGLSKRIVLVDGAAFARLMIRYDVGCRKEEELFIKRLDEDFFEI